MERTGAVNFILFFLKFLDERKKGTDRQHWEEDKLTDDSGSDLHIVMSGYKVK